MRTWCLTGKRGATMAVTIDAAPDQVWPWLVQLGGDPGGQVWGAPKSHEQREVPITRFLVDDIAEHIRGKKPDELVFTGVRGGGALRAAVFGRAGFDKAAEAICVAGLHPHELRHTAASLAIASGANVKLAQLMLGHKSATVTLDQSATCSGTIWTRSRTGWMPALRRRSERVRIGGTQPPRWSAFPPLTVSRRADPGNVACSAPGTIPPTSTPGLIGPARARFRGLPADSCGLKVI